MLNCLSSCCSWSYPRLHCIVGSGFIPEIVCIAADAVRSLYIQTKGLPFPYRIDLRSVFERLLRRRCCVFEALFRRQCPKTAGRSHLLFRRSNSRPRRRTAHKSLTNASRLRRWGCSLKKFLFFVYSGWCRESASPSRANPSLLVYSVSNLEQFYGLHEPYLTSKHAENGN